MEFEEEELAPAPNWIDQLVPGGSPDSSNVTGYCAGPATGVYAMLRISGSPFTRTEPFGGLAK
jgi:hypothetical protein